MYNNPVIQRCSYMIMSIRTDLFLYRGFIKNNMPIQAKSTLNNALVKVEILKSLTEKLKDYIIEADLELRLGVTKTVSYNQIIQKAA